MSGLAGGSDSSRIVLSGRNCSLVMDRPYIVGILNVTPDSFSDGGRFLRPQQAIEQGRRMAAEGADLIDIGGESTRPGAPQVSEQEELDRVIPVVEKLGREVGLPLSIDTSKSVVAREAVSAGADFVNDVSGLTFDTEMAGMVADSGAGLIIMHTRGRPEVMQRDTRYADLFAEVVASLNSSIKVAVSAGIAIGKIAIDPGIGFGKSPAGNLELIAGIGRLLDLGRPVLIGPSRKAFIGAILDVPVEERLEGTIAACTSALARGARLFRVHDVLPVRRALDVAWAIRSSGTPGQAT